MARVLPRFDLHEWHVHNGAEAKFDIGSSGLPLGDLSKYAPSTPAEWSKLWSTPPRAFVVQITEQLEAIYGFERKELLLTEGASEAAFLGAFGIAGPGAHVIVEHPAYFSLLEPSQSLGCRVTRIRRTPQNGFSFPVPEVLVAITKDTRLICLARPHNPTGQRVPDGELRAIAEAAARVGAYVLVDEVFAEATKDGDVPARRLHDHILSVNSVTKCMGFGPLQLGWIAAPPDVTARLHRAKAHTRPLNPTLSLGLAARVLPHRGAILQKARARRGGNVETLRSFLSEHPELAWYPPSHGTTAVVQPPGPGFDDLAFSQALLEHEGVLVSPGSYIEMPGWFRIGLLCEPKTLKAGLARLAHFLSAKNGNGVRKASTVKATAR